MKILTVYFSMKGETISSGMKIVNLEKGNTASAAEFIQEAVSGDLFEIQTVKTYLKDHIHDNFNIFDFALDDEDMSIIRSMDTGKGTHNPDNMANAVTLGMYKIH